MLNGNKQKQGLFKNQIKPTIQKEKISLDEVSIGNLPQKLRLSDQCKSSNLRGLEGEITLSSLLKSKNTFGLSLQQN